MTADATLTVNLNADPSATTSSDNDFTFRSDTSKAVTINVGQMLALPERTRFKRHPR